MAHTSVNVVQLNQLQRWRMHRSLENEEVRLKFLLQIDLWIEEGTTVGPGDIRIIFNNEDIDYILKLDPEADPVTGRQLTGIRLIEFLSRTGFREEALLDEKGQPVLRRNTPVHHHHAANQSSAILRILINMYPDNYINNEGISHFHICCLRGFYDVVEKFLDIYHIDPNACAIPRTGNSPLHLALARGHHRVAELLVRRGANPNTANEERSTPLHMICRSLANYGIDWAEWLMKLCDELHRPLHVNSQDHEGNAPLHLVQRAHMNPVRCLKTSRALLERGADVNLINADGQAPLLLAVCSLMPDVVKFLLDNGADLSIFLFPERDSFDAIWGRNRCVVVRLQLVGNVVLIMNHLQQRGFSLSEEQGLTIMEMIFEEDLFGSPIFSEDFLNKVKSIRLRRNLSLYDILKDPLERTTTSRLRFYRDSLIKYSRSEGLKRLLPEERVPCARRLSEVMTRAFFRSCALQPLWRIVHYRIPVLCCEMILEMLNNEELNNICLASSRL